MSPMTVERELGTSGSPRPAADETVAPRPAGWLRAVAPLWPLGLARLLYGYLWWQQSAWKVPSDDFGRKSGGDSGSGCSRKSSIRPSPRTETSSSTS